MKRNIHHMDIDKLKELGKHLGQTQHTWERDTDDRRWAMYDPNFTRRRLTGWIGYACLALAAILLLTWVGK